MPSRSWVKQSGPPAAFLLAVIGFIYLLADLVPEDKRIFVPRPHEIWQKSFGDAKIRSDILEALYGTTKSSVVGLGIAVVLGIGFAVAMAQSRRLERGLFPWAVVLQTVPTLALVPLIGIWFGFGFMSRVIVVVLISIFPIITNTFFGISSVDHNLHDLMRLHHASRLTILFRLQFPAAMPAIFTGFRISAGLSVIGSIVGEFFFGRGGAGLGVLVNKYRSLLQVEELYATIVVSSILGVTAFSIINWANRRVIGHWHESMAGDS